MKTCIIVNRAFSWMLHVDDKSISFQGFDNAEYFKELYTGLGYETFKIDEMQPATAGQRRTTNSAMSPLSEETEAPTYESIDGVIGETIELDGSAGSTGAKSPNCDWLFFLLGTICGGEIVTLFVALIELLK